MIIVKLQIKNYVFYVDSYINIHLLLVCLCTKTRIHPRYLTDSLLNITLSFHHNEIIITWC